MKLHKLKTGLVHRVVFWTTRSLSASLQKLSSSTKAMEALILDAWLTSRRPGTRRTSPWRMFSHFEPDISEQQASLNIIFPANGPQNTRCTRQKLSFQSCSVHSIKGVSTRQRRGEGMQLRIEGKMLTVTKNSLPVDACAL